MTRPVLERIALRLKPVAGGCLVWTGATQGAGYGVVRLGPAENRRQVYVHRWMYEHHIGPIPEGFEIDHLCRNTLCANPEHLEAVTPQCNTLRSENPCAINARKTRCVNDHPFSGENLGHSGGKRYCRECKRRRSAEYARAKKRREKATA